MVAVVAVGVLGSMALGEIDNYYGITDRVILALDELSQKGESKIQQTKQDLLDKAGVAATQIIDYAIDSAKVVLIDAVKHQLHNF
ncbi:MAG: hypothetical protein P8104_10850, partial [Gammaproteobacteria bacterium]